jgi:valyl-tRNA synthetase
MIKHIVMWTLKDSYEGKDKQALIQEFKDKLEALQDTISEVRSLEVGVNISPRPSAQDLVLYTEFDDSAALDRYRNHPDHLKVVEWVKNVVQDGYVVDYET